jgi:hypothetical protein
MQSPSIRTRDLEARRKVGKGFQLLGGLAGIPSFIGACFFGWQVFTVPGPQRTLPIDPGANSLSNLYATVMNTTDKALQFGAGFMKAILFGLAILCAVIAVLALIWFLTGRALRRDKVWAPALATILLGKALLVFAVLALSFGLETAAIAPAFASVASATGIWMLWRSR